MVHGNASSCRNAERDQLRRRPYPRRPGAREPGTGSGVESSRL